MGLGFEAKSPNPYLSNLVIIAITATIVIVVLITSISSSSSSSGNTKALSRRPPWS